MGAGVSRDVLTRAIHNGLKAVVATHGGIYETGRVKGRGWIARYDTLRASNGEVALMPVVTYPTKVDRDWGAFDRIPKSTED